MSEVYRETGNLNWSWRSQATNLPPHVHWQQVLQTETTLGPVRFKVNPWSLRLILALSHFPSREVDTVHETQISYKNQNKGLGRWPSEEGTYCANLKIEFRSPEASESQPWWHRYTIPAFLWWDGRQRQKTPEGSWDNWPDIQSDMRFCLKRSGRPGATPKALLWPLHVPMCTADMHGQMDRSSIYVNHRVGGMAWRRYPVHAGLKKKKKHPHQHLLAQALTSPSSSPASKGLPQLWTNGLHLF